MNKNQYDQLLFSFQFRSHYSHVLAYVIFFYIHFFHSKDFKSSTVLHELTQKQPTKQMSLFKLLNALKTQIQHELLQPHTRSISITASIGYYISITTDPRKQYITIYKGHLLHFSTMIPNNNKLRVNITHEIILEISDSSG